MGRAAGDGVQSSPVGGTWRQEETLRGGQKRGGDSGVITERRSREQTSVGTQVQCKRKGRGTHAPSPAGSLGAPGGARRPLSGLPGSPEG